jgi:dephospho-CoA kinase
LKKLIDSFFNFESMLVVGVTGGIGSGKSTVCNIFELLGIPVYQSDERARMLCNTHPGIRHDVSALFGSEAYVNGQYNRVYIGSKVFGHPELLASLNAIIHPRVASDFKSWCLQQRQVPFVIKEAAILFESGADRQVDKIITVTAPVNLRLQRVIRRDHTDPQQVLARMNSQWSDEIKIERSHFVVYCDEKQLVIPQVLNIYQQLMSLWD